MFGWFFCTAFLISVKKFLRALALTIFRLLWFKSCTQINYSQPMRPIKFGENRPGRTFLCRFEFFKYHFLLNHSRDKFFSFLKAKTLDLEC